ncbi:E3 ubiquitin-protein ligase RNF26-like [Lucilia cuprina]|uniref:E3 ubiquitin-protein ligase RNF26-like n=1 Tax=Lucilia cuprina TaxID=7375 RepID=UPI001F063B19|nr:E3 ubiquitin-protein ligase RNF26-like [Lucilia cuprina]
MVYPKNKTCSDMEPYEDVFEELVYLEEKIEEDDVEDHIEPRNIEIKLCFVCVNEEPNTLFLPCKHMKMCYQCFLKLQAQAIVNNGQLNCPVCRQAVVETMQVFL